MKLIMLENFISKLGFVHDRTIRSYGNSININVSDMKDGTKRIKGTVTMKMGVNEVEAIDFESYLTQSDSILRFRSKYRIISFGGNNKLKPIAEGIYMPASYSNEIKYEDVFAIFEQDKKSILPPKSKLLVHKENGSITQVYSVSKKYNFDKGISDSFPLLNMNNEQIADSVNLACGGKYIRR